jgi:hypothetical protein
MTVMSTSARCSARACAVKLDRVSSATVDVVNDAYILVAGSRDVDETKVSI